MPDLLRLPDPGPLPPVGRPVDSLAGSPQFRTTSPRAGRVRHDVPVDEGNIAEICGELRQDALHNLSLGGKELFHSDFLAWFAQSYTEEAAHVFSGYAQPGDHGRGEVAEREHEHLDLILRLPRLQLIVIENKVWSLPDDAQLAAYAAGPITGLRRDLGADTAQVLLSLTPPAWDDPGARVLGGLWWKYLSYRELARRLEPAAERLGKSASADDRFAGQLVQRYAAWVERLCRLSEEVTAAPSEPVLLDDAILAVLDRARIGDGVSKLRGRRVMSALLEHLRAENPSVEALAPGSKEAEAFQPQARWQLLRLRGRAAGLEVSFSRGMPVLSGAVAVDGGDKLFWQYQNGQWRLAVTTARHQGSTLGVIARRHAYVASRYSKWFDFKAVEDLLGTDRGSQVLVKGNQGFQRFNPDFAYRYAKVDQGGLRTTVRELIQLGIHYLNRAASWPAG
jgi:hypothetical protein